MRRIYLFTDNRNEQARAFYEANSLEMDRGAVVLWPAWESLFALMTMRWTMGDYAFRAEKQNEPMDPDLCVFAAQSIHYWDDEHTDEQRLLDALIE